MRDSIRVIWIFFGLGGTICIVVGIALLMGWIRPPNQQEFQAADWYLTSVTCILLGCTFFVFPMALLYCSPRGDWKVDQTGVSFNSLRGRSVSLKWEEIERVKWQETDAILNGSEKKISFPWQLFEKSKRKEAKAFLHNRLKPCFDIYIYEEKRRMFSFDPNFRSITKWVVKIVGVIAIAMIPLMGVLIALHFFAYSLPVWARWMPLIGVTWSCFFPIIYLMFLNRTQLRRMHGWHLRKNVIAED